MSIKIGTAEHLPRRLLAGDSSGGLDGGSVGVGIAIGFAIGVVSVLALLWLLRKLKGNEAEALAKAPAAPACSASPALSATPALPAPKAFSPTAAAAAGAKPAVLSSLAPPPSHVRQSTADQQFFSPLTSMALKGSNAPAAAGQSVQGMLPVSTAASYAGPLPPADSFAVPVLGVQSSLAPCAIISEVSDKASAPTADLTEDQAATLQQEGAAVVVITAVQRPKTTTTTTTTVVQAPNNAPTTLAATSGTAATVTQQQQGQGPQSHKRVASLADAYAEDDVDDDWAVLLAEIDVGLEAKGKTPMDARERAVAVRKLVQATRSSGFDGAVAAALHEVLRHRAFTAKAAAMSAAAGSS